MEGQEKRTCPGKTENTRAGFLVKMQWKGGAYFFVMRAIVVIKNANQRKQVIIFTMPFDSAEKLLGKPAGNTGKLKSMHGYWMLYFHKTAVLFLSENSLKS